MNPALQRDIAARGGVFTREVLRDSGHSDDDLRRWLTDKSVRRVARGIYAPGPTPTTGDRRLIELALGYGLTRGASVAASHHSALLLHGLPLAGVPRGRA